MQDNSKRHAYIMMVHNEWRILRLILDILDDERNDFFIHIDRKVKDEEIPYELTDVLKKSGVYMIPRMDVTWGGDSQIFCVMGLLKAASSGHYKYYHFISGVDMPLMSADRIFSFFYEHEGANFFEYHNPLNSDMDRIRYYYFCQNKIGKGLDNETLFFQKIKGWLLKIQKALQINRLSNESITFYKGEAWFSITDEMAQYFVSSEKRIRKLFTGTWCGDEMCWNTIALNGPYADSVKNDCLRYIDWEAGDPYVFCKKDYLRILNSGKLFARKFSDSTDSEIVDMIYEKVTGRKAEEISNE